MTKELLAQCESSAVRHNAALFDAFQKYLIEDWGQIPQGCFGCDFQKHFTAWAKPYLTKTKVELKKQENMTKGYVLVDQDFKTFFKGEVLSRHSSDKEWAAFINDNKDKIEARKKLFRVLPSEVSTDSEKTAEQLAEAELAEARKKNLTHLVGVDEAFDIASLTKKELVEFAAINKLDLGALTAKSNKDEL